MTEIENKLQIVKKRQPEGEYRAEKSEINRFISEIIDKIRYEVKRLIPVLAVSAGAAFGAAEVTESKIQGVTGVTNDPYHETSLAEGLPGADHGTPEKEKDILDKAKDLYESAKKLGARAIDATILKVYNDAMRTMYEAVQNATNYVYWKVFQFSFLAAAISLRSMLSSYEAKRKAALDATQVVVSAEELEELRAIRTDLDVAIAQVSASLEASLGDPNPGEDAGGTAARLALRLEGIDKRARAAGVPLALPSAKKDEGEG